MLADFSQLNVSKQLPGYIYDKRITGPNTAISELQIPKMNGRDLSNYLFIKQDGIEYLHIDGLILVDEEAVEPINFSKQAIVTIPSTGYAQWYTILEQVEDKTLKVDIPPNGSFAIYDTTGTCIYFSVVEDNAQVKLPVAGTIVFAGVQFEISVE